MVLIRMLVAPFEAVMRSAGKAEVLSFEAASTLVAAKRQLAVEATAANLVRKCMLIAPFDVGESLGRFVG
jgi:hypothetical protein